MEVFVKQEVRVFNWMLFKLMFMGMVSSRIVSRVVLVEPGTGGVIDCSQGWVMAMRRREPSSTGKKCRIPP